MGGGGSVGDINDKESIGWVDGWVVVSQHEVLW